MCEDEDKTVIKKRDAQGSESKRAEPAECKESQQQSRDLSSIENTGGCRHKQAVCGGGVGHPEKESSHTGTTSVQATASTGVPELPKAGVHRSPTQLGVGLEVGGKLGVINWPRSGVEALGKHWASPSQSIWGSCLRFPLRHLWKPSEQQADC